MTPTSSLLPTSSPSPYPTLEDLPTDDGSAAALTKKNGYSFITIGVIETLVIVIAMLMIAVSCLCFHLYRRERKFRSSNVAMMMRTHEEADKL